MKTSASPLTQADKPLALELPVFIATRTVINTMMRMVYPFLGVFGRGLGVDLFTLSRALTLRSATGLIGPLLASVGDSRGRKTGMLLGVGLFTIGAGVMAVWPGLPAFVLMLMLSIMANFVFVPSMQAYLGDKIPYQQRGRVLGLTEFGWSLAYIVGVPLVGFVMARSGWQAPFPWLAGFGVLAIVVLAWMLPGDQTPAVRRPGLMRNLRLVLTSGAALAGIAVGMGLSGGNELLNVVYGVWLEESFNVQIGGLSIAAFLIGFAELGGEALVSGLVDSLGKRRAVIIGMAANGLAALFVVLLGSSLPGALAGLVLFYLTFEFTIVSCMPLMTEVLPAARATFMAAFIASTALGRALGSLAAPWLFEMGKSIVPGSPLIFTAGAVALLDLCALAALGRIREGGHRA